MTKDTPFTNREIQAYFENYNEALQRLEKTVETRVAPLETELAKLLLWREGIMGKVSIIIIVLGTLWTLAVSIVTRKIL